MRILLLRGGALGDFVVTLPAIALLRKRWPSARIELAGNPAAAAIGLRSGRGNEAVAIGGAQVRDTASLPRPLHPAAIDGRAHDVTLRYLDAVHAQSDARWSRLGSGTLRVRENSECGGGLDAFTAWLASFDLVINFWPDADGAIAADFARLGFVTPNGEAWRADESTGATKRRFLSASAAPQQAPVAAHFCVALAPLGLATEDFRARIFPSDDDAARASALLDGGAVLQPAPTSDDIRSQRGLKLRATPDASLAPPFIALHPGSGSPKKTWPLDRWLAVVRALRKDARDSFRLIVLLGEVEHATLSAEIEKTFSAGTLVLRSPATPVLAAVLQRCALFLGHDSGPAHVAAAVGCPCVLVFGPTDPAMWAPPGEHVRVVQRGTATTDVSINDVLATVRTGAFDSV